MRSNRASSSFDCLALFKRALIRPLEPQIGTRAISAVQELLPILAVLGSIMGRRDCHEHVLAGIRRPKWDADLEYAILTDTRMELDSV